MDPNYTDKNNTPPAKDDFNQNQALEILRNKIDQLYDTEPPAKEELEQLRDISPNSRQMQASKFSERKISPIAAANDQAPSNQPTPKDQIPQNTKLTKHQQFMANLKNSGKSLAEIQTAWHEYYINLPDTQKHEIWQDFYRQSKSSGRAVNEPPKGGVDVIGPQQTTPQPRDDQLHPPEEPSAKTNLKYAKTKKTAADLRQQIFYSIRNQKKASKSHNIKSLVFGLSMGCLTLLVLSFGFFNERFIAPFITPSRTVTDTPIIVDGSLEADGPESKIIIPKINVEAPIVFGQESVNEDDVQNALEDGVLHYGITSQPGELGNASFFGHSSNNLLNRGAYKFVFVLLSRLEEGDTFMVQKDGQRYVYKVYDKTIVEPTELSVLEPDPNRPAIATLITCDPPGTARNRLVIAAEQITPDPNQNIASTAEELEGNTPEVLPSDAPSLWSRIRNWFSSS